MKRGHLQERIPEDSVLEVLLNTDMNPSFAIMQMKDAVDLLPARFDLAFAEAKLALQRGCGWLLREALSQVRESYEYIIIDPPPTPGLLATNAVVAATSLLIPIPPPPHGDGGMYPSLPVLYRLLRRIRKHKPIRDGGAMVLTLYEARTSFNALFAWRVRAEYALSLHFLVV
jgi:chromosome partitioning protein